MADKQEIELFISEDGELKVHIKGIKGSSCLKVLDSLANDLGTIKDKELTSEYYESSQAQDNSVTKLKKDRPS